MARPGRKRDPLKEADPWSLLPTSVNHKALFDSHLVGSKTELDSLMCFYKHDKMKRLKRIHWDELYRLVSKFITYCELGNFKQFQTDEVHSIRIIAYYEWQRLMVHKSPKWCRFTFQKAFADFLAVLQCRQYGIALPHDSCLLNVKTKFIKYFKFYFIAKRKKLSIPEFITSYEQIRLHEDVLVEYEYYFRWVEQALLSCPSAVYYGCEQLERADAVSIF